jgi:hypothetical protein
MACIKTMSKNFAPMCSEKVSSYYKSLTNPKGSDHSLQGYFALLRITLNCIWNESVLAC